MDKQQVISFLISEDRLSWELVECIRKQSKEMDNIDIQSLSPPYARFIRIYQRRLELGQARGQDTFFLQQLENIIVFLRQNQNEPVYVVTVDCDQQTNVFFVGTSHHQLYYIGMLFGAKVPIYARKKPI